MFRTKRPCLCQTLSSLMSCDHPARSHNILDRNLDKTSLQEYHFDLCPLLYIHERANRPKRRSKYSHSAFPPLSTLIYYYLLTFSSCLSCFCYYWTARPPPTAWISSCQLPMIVPRWLLSVAVQVGVSNGLLWTERHCVMC